MIHLVKTSLPMARRLIPPHFFGIHWLRFFFGLLIVVPALGGEPLDVPKPGDDGTFRATILVRKGAALGTGTIIGSLPGETLILTAAHVVEDPGVLYIELNRFNLGMERTSSSKGFPRRLAATIAARDRDSDLAILRVGGELELPYIVRIAPDNRPIAPGTPVTSIGFDRGERLIGFPSRVKRIDRVDMERGGGDRPFLITEHPPEVGRSGGGLFLDNGILVGVCIARAQLVPGQVLGMYSTVGNVQRLLATKPKLAGIVAQSRPVVAAHRAATEVNQESPVPRIDRTGSRVRAN